MIISGVEGIDYTVLEDDTISGDMNRDELTHTKKKKLEKRNK